MRILYSSFDCNILGSRNTFGLVQDIGDNIKKIRSSKNITQKELAISAQIPQSTLSKIESGRDFLWSRLVRISRVLEVETRDIVCFGQSHNSNDKTKSDDEILKLLRDEIAFLRKIVERFSENSQIITKNQNNQNNQQWTQK